MLIVQKKYNSLFHITGIILIGLILTIPATSGNVFEAMDLIGYHLKWSKHFSEQFWMGDFYPRWLLEMNAGLGSPTFFFYGSIPYYFTSLFHPFFTNDPQGWHQLSSSAAFALVASGITAYVWLTNLTTRNAAFIGSILYMALPYHLAIDLYARFAFAEYWSFVWIPLILFFSKKMIDGSRLSVAGFAVSYALLIMTHLITVLIFFIVPISYILFMVDRQRRKKVLHRMVVAVLLAIGLAAVYLLPAIVTQKYVSPQTIMEGIYYYSNNFLFSSFDPHQNRFKLYVSIQTLLMGGVAFCAFFLTRTNQRLSCRRESIYWIVVYTIGLFMTLPLSRPVWEIFSVLQKVQHPWRFNVVLTVATTALVALGISSLRKSITFLDKKTVSVGALLIAILLSSGFIVTYIYTSPALYKYTVLDKPLDINKELEISMDGKEYRPKWVPPKLFQASTINEIGKSFNNAQIAIGQGSLSVKQWKPREIFLETNATTDIWLTLHQFYYPGWTAKLNSQSSFLPVRPSIPEGLLQVWVPAGNYKVTVKLEARLEERIGQLISAVCAFMVLYSSFLFRENGDIVSSRAKAHRLYHLPR